MKKTAKTEIKKEDVRNLHKVVISWYQNCKFKCTNAVSKEQRVKIIKEFWQRNLKEQKSFVMNPTEC